MDSFGGIVNRFNDAAASAGDILRRNFMNSPTAGQSMETLTERLKRLVPGSNTGGTAPVQPRAGIKMPASGYRAPSIPSPIQTGPGVTPVKISLMPQVKL